MENSSNDSNEGFFSKLFDLINGVDLKMTIKRKGDKLTVGIFADPRIEDTAKSHITPLLLTGTPDELDRELLSQITKPLQTVSAWAVDMKDFEEAMVKAEAESKRAKKEKEENEAKKSKADKKVDEAEKLIEDNKPRQAIPVLHQALEIYGDHKKAKELLNTAKSNAGIVDLFAESNTNS